MKAAIWLKINALTPQYRGILWERLTAGADGQIPKVFEWPCPDENHPGNTDYAPESDSPAV